MKDNFGNRMKNYEQVSNLQLEKKIPVAIRLDGKAFHTFTRGFRKPFDDYLISAMQKTMKYLCENIQGCVFGYTQSDEITLILIDYQNENSDAWFDYRISKMCSVAASMATLEFNRVFNKEIKDEIDSCQLNKYCRAIDAGALFDARCFNIPQEEVANLIYWRQADAIRNSIQSVGQYYFSQKQLHKKSCEEIKEMLKTEESINWDALPNTYKYGSCCIKRAKFLARKFKGLCNIEFTETVMRKKWEIDNNIPIFKGEDRQYIEKFICKDYCVSM